MTIYFHTWPLALLSRERAQGELRRLRRGEPKPLLSCPSPSYLDRPEFQRLLRQAEEEFGFKHHMGLTIPCDEVAFCSLTSALR
ncbi:hypothetical protein Cni_G28101 [Canna indica]|uniref:Uncharacterized protein n=1 Tax=Canna indica TaxID=4628 RepID=A0AAQ3QS03_9LILI|nr:hypothetical protein Cni_G28101 [Canna indica]